VRAAGRLASLLALLVALLMCLPGESTAASKKRKKRTKPKAAVVDFDPKLPVLGTRLTELPPGEGKVIADAACLMCHSSDMLRQQRLTEKQWTASVTKMVGWGAQVPESKRDALVAYLAKNFGPDNDRFEPIITRPVGK
jgi:hypothetical protein